MATKTISIDVEAWETLRRARRTPQESFSKVIKRAHWEEPRTAAAFLARMEGLPTATEDELARLDEIQRQDAPPEDKWQRG